ncbi:NADH:flavin oxidoreductase/NADH oxidase [Streptomyces hygroscopicus]|uniref:NADH:flavin oxidoreductase/NADH oxidase n=1 Tax=Streptomyces hygroscopicus TaxID=1912 RepID=UPI003636FD05
MSHLFTPLPLRDVTLRNRVVVAPMWQYAGVGGMPTDWHLMHLGRFADGGAALVFQEATSVERRGCGTLGDVGIWDDSFVEPLSRLARIMRDNGAVPGIQIGHSGRKARMKTPMAGRGPLERTPGIPDWDDWEPIAPSPVPLKEGFEPPREMTTQDIDDVVSAFGAAAHRAARAGYQALEIHAGHGYLLHQFLSPLTNRRKDRYGGTLENRTRIVLEVAEAVRESWPDHLPLFIRLSCVDNAGWELSDTISLVRELASLGVDVFDCSAGGLVGSPVRTGANLTYGYQVEYARAVRQATGVRTMAVGLLVHAQHAEQVVANGDSDLIAIAREALHNPNWPLDAALKLKVEDPYSLTAPTSGFWLRQRAAKIPGFVPSTQAP